MFRFPSFYEQTGELGMQPELLYPRRSRFAPMDVRGGVAFTEMAGKPGVEGRSAALPDRTTLPK
jgi:hypothetical protein